jgi:transcriptional regulator with XRE-family HTH domain
MTTGEKIKQLRKRDNYSQEDLAEKLNISRTTLYNWENDNGLPDGNSIARLSKLFHVSTDYLLGLSTKQPYIENTYTYQHNINKEKLLEVYRKLIEIISLYEESQCYNMIPERFHVDNQEAWDFYERMINDVRLDVNTYFLGDDEIFNKLITIIDETEYFLKIYEMPGVCQRWQQLNPDIMYFDCAFDILEKEPELYEQIKAGKYHNISLNYYPTEVEASKRKKYFQKRKEDNDILNYRYSKERWFQNELLHTLQCVFKNDFADILIS